MDNSQQFDQNPFASIMQSLQGAGAQGGQPQGPQAPQGVPPQGMGADMPDNQLMKGKNPDSSQALIGATKMLQQFIADSTDSTDIATARSIVMLITRLIEKQQKKMSDQLPQDQAMMSAMGPQGSPAPQGQ